MYKHWWPLSNRWRFQCHRALTPFLSTFPDGDGLRTVSTERGNSKRYPSWRPTLSQREIINLALSRGRCVSILLNFNCFCSTLVFFSRSIDTKPACYPAFRFLYCIRIGFRCWKIQKHYRFDSMLRICNFVLSCCKVLMLLFSASMCFFIGRKKKVRKKLRTFITN